MGSMCPKCRDAAAGWARAASGAGNRWAAIAAAGAEGAEEARKRRKRRERRKRRRITVRQTAGGRGGSYGRW